jgi:hypothetical protein
MKASNSQQTWMRRWLLTMVSINVTLFLKSSEEPGLAGSNNSLMMTMREMTGETTAFSDDLLYLQLRDSKFSPAASL